MKVLHVIPSIASAHGGPTRALFLMERSLKVSGVLVESVTTDDDGDHLHNGKPCGLPLQENGATRRYFPKRIEFYKVSPGFARWIIRHVRDYDVVHIHALFSFTSTLAAWAARRAGVPYVLRPLGALTRYGVTKRRPWLKCLSVKWIEGPLLRDASAVHFTSDDELREATEYGVILRGVVIPLGIEEAVPTNDEMVRAHLPALAGSRYVLYLSRLDPKKNVEGLLHAFSQCSPQYPDVKLLVAGSGAAGYVARLKTLADELGLVTSVVWAGHIDGDLKASALAGAELFVLPSFSENFGIAAAEALMAGLPCLLGKGVAIAQDVVSAGAGVVVQPDSASIAAGLQQVLTNSDMRASMSLRARELAHGKYSAAAMGARLVALYAGILGR